MDGTNNNARIGSSIIFKCFNIIFFNYVFISMCGYVHVSAGAVELELQVDGTN